MLRLAPNKFQEAALVTPRRCRGTRWWPPRRTSCAGPPPRLPSVKHLRRLLLCSSHLFGPLPPYTSRSGSVSRAPPCMLLPLFLSKGASSSTRRALRLLLALRRSRLRGYLLPLPVASLPHHLPPLIASLCPSTVCPSSWAFCRPEVSLGMGGLPSPGVKRSWRVPEDSSYGP